MKSIETGWDWFKNWGKRIGFAVGMLVWTLGLVFSGYLWVRATTGTGAWHAAGAVIIAGLPAAAAGIIVASTIGYFGYERVKPRAVAWILSPVAYAGVSALAGAPMPPSWEAIGTSVVLPGAVLSHLYGVYLLCRDVWFSDTESDGRNKNAPAESEEST